MAQAAKSAVKDLNSSGQSAYMNPTSNRAATSSTTTIGSNAVSPVVGFIALPKLTQPEKDLLDLHQGCYKCCIFYAGHFSHTCTTKCPSLDACKRVTTAHALKAKAAFEKSTTPVITAVFDTGLNEDFVDEDFVDSDEFNKYVPLSDIAPLPEHLWWDCCIDAPFTCVPSLI
jgi:hypothetical protein